jgi:hypothetical protein
VFRNRTRLVKWMGVILALMLVLSFTLPLLLSGR